MTVRSPSLGALTFVLLGASLQDPPKKPLSIEDLYRLEGPRTPALYPGEGHGIRRPRHREDVLRRTLAWFERHGR